MSLKALLVKNGRWKTGLALAAGIAAGALAGPIGGKAVGFLVPKALEHVSDTPISDLKEHKSPFSKELITHDPPEVILRIAPRERAMIADAAKDHGATLRWQCRGVSP